jgi:hypothetical protein
MSKPIYFSRGLMMAGALFALALTINQASAQLIIPGTGTRVAIDDFEADGWDFFHNHPKSSEEQDGQVRRHPIVMQRRAATRCYRRKN